MALVAVTATPQAVTIQSGTPVSVSAAVTLGFSSATCASGPSMPAGTFNWPGPIGEEQTLFVATATTANLNYIS